MKFLPAVSMVLLSGLAACGQTGPLHLPQDAPQKESYLLKKRLAPPAAAAPVSSTSSLPSDASPPATDKPTP